MANKKLFENLVLGTPSSTDRFAFGKAGSAYKNITYGDLKNLIVAAVPSPPSPPLLTQKVVNIGAFDMAGSGELSKDVSLGVQRSKIRSAQVMILSNDGGLYPMAMPAGNKELKSYWFIRQESAYASNARVHIYSDARTNPSFFDQGAFNGNGPSNNRGYITIWYVA